MKCSLLTLAFLPVLAANGAVVTLSHLSFAAPTATTESLEISWTDNASLVGTVENGGIRFVHYQTVSRVVVHRPTTTFTAVSAETPVAVTYTEDVYASGAIQSGVQVVNTDDGRTQYRTWGQRCDFDYANNKGECVIVNGHPPPTPVVSGDHTGDIFGGPGTATLTGVPVAWTTLTGAFEDFGKPTSVAATSPGAPTSTNAGHSPIAPVAISAVMVSVLAAGCVLFLI